MVRVEVQGAMQTPDGAWRVEAVREYAYGSTRATQSVWYRIQHDGETFEKLSITEVHRILAEAGVDIATLEEVTTTEGS